MMDNMNISPATFRSKPWKFTSKEKRYVHHHTKWELSTIVGTCLELRATHMGMDQYL